MADEPEKSPEPQEPREQPADEKHVDEDWKEEAKREKERLATETSSPKEGVADPETAQSRELPEPSFDLMVTNLAIQALIALGEIANPVTHRQECDLDQAKHTIDLLGILDDKTRGNLTEQEERHLHGTLYELRTRYLQGGRS